MAQAMRRAQRKWPIGTLHPAEGAAIRHRGILARAVGELQQGEGWSVHGLPAEHFQPAGLPRSIAVISVRDLDEALEVAAPWSAHLSTVGSDDFRGGPTWLELGASRVCRPGRMQRPPLRRAHDGVDWIQTTLRAVSDELS